MTKITENTIEEFSIELLEGLGYEYVYVPTVVLSFIKKTKNNYQGRIVLNILPDCC